MTVNREPGGWSRRPFEWLRAWRVDGGGSGTAGGHAWDKLHWLDHAPPTLLRRESTDGSGGGGGGVNGGGGGGRWVALTGERCAAHEAALGAGIVFTHYAWHTATIAAFKQRYYGTSFEEALPRWRVLQRAGDAAAAWHNAWAAVAPSERGEFPPAAQFGGEAAAAALEEGARPLAAGADGAQRAELQLRLPLPLGPFFPWVQDGGGGGGAATVLVDRSWRRVLAADVPVHEAPPLLRATAEGADHYSSEVEAGREHATTAGPDPAGASSDGAVMGWAADARSALESDAALLRAEAGLLAAGITATFVAIARSVAPHVLRQTAMAVEASATRFADYRVLIFENDSAGGTNSAEKGCCTGAETKQWLAAWARRNPKVHAVCCNGLGRGDAGSAADDCGCGRWSSVRATDPRSGADADGAAFPKRPHRTHAGFSESLRLLAAARNVALREALGGARSTLLRDFEADVLVVMDADLMHGWSQRGFLSAAAALRLPGAAVQDSAERASAGWDVVCANGVRDRAGNTRDAFAWRSDEQPFSEAQYVAAQMQAGTGVAAAREAYWDNVLPKLQVPHSCCSMVGPLRSCFGGIALYSGAALRDTNCTYDEFTAGAAADCEHVAINQCLASHGKRLGMLPPFFLEHGFVD